MRASGCPPPEAPAHQADVRSPGLAIGGAIHPLRELGQPRALLTQLADLVCQLGPIPLPRIDLALRISPAAAEQMAERGRRLVHAFASGIGTPPAIDLSHVMASVRAPMQLSRLCLRA